MVINSYKLINILPFAIIFIFAIGCEGHECTNGVVYDLDTRKPLDSVLCSSNGVDKVYTDSFGRFKDVCGPFGDCIPKCPELEIDFSKEGYINQKVSDFSDTVFLERIDSTNLDFE